MRSEWDEEKTFDIQGDIHVGDLAPDGGQLRPFIVWFEEPVPKLEKAVYIVEDADVFVIIGTSLQVYPAAGLINYVPKHVPRYIIDKHIPSLPSYLNVTAIESTATEGVKKLRELLM